MCAWRRSKPQHTSSAGVHVTSVDANRRGSSFRILEMFSACVYCVMRISGVSPGPHPHRMPHSDQLRRQSQQCATSVLSGYAHVPERDSEPKAWQARLQSE